MQDNNYYYFIKESSVFPEFFSLWGDERVTLASSRKEFTEKAKEYIDSYSEAANIEDLYDRAQYIHDKLCLNMRYSYDENGEPSEEFFAHSVYGPVMQKEGVCEAYARAYQMLCT